MNMKCGKKMYISIFWVALGIGLLMSGMLGHMDEFWSGMGAAFIAVGALQLIRAARYSKNAEYREKVDIENKDERNRFIANKAWASAGYVYVIIAAIATIALRLCGLDDMSILVSGSMCLLLVFYWVFYLILKRKY